MISQKEREILRELAGRQLEIANSEENRQCVEAWYAHNDFTGKRPMLHIEIDTFEEELFPPMMRCTDAQARRLERDLYHNFYNFEVFRDDKAVPGYFPVEWKSYFHPFGFEVARQSPSDSGARQIGHRFLHPITDLERDFETLGPSRYGVDKAGTLAYLHLAEDVFGDILPVRTAMQCLYAVPTQQVVHLMGMEAMMMAFYDCPEIFHRLMSRLADDTIAWFEEMERDGFLLPTSGFERLGQGSFCFTHGLPHSPPVKTNDVWGFLDSQETVCISPDMFAEFIFPYYQQIAERYGRLSYGCCEPVDPVWQSLSKLPNLAKVSISPWCNQAVMGENLRGKNIVFHRKPSPNYLGLAGPLDEEAVRAHIRETVEAARGCTLEITQRDVYSVEGDCEKVKSYVRLVREVIEDHWS